MEAYIARQPIFNCRKKVEGYELLYRDSLTVNQANISNGCQATSRLLSDAITVFGLPQLTNWRPAYINFTKDLIMNDFVLLAQPQDIVVEIVEDIKITNVLLQKLQFLKDEGYVLALDDYTGDPAFQRLLPYMDIVKVDFRLTDYDTQCRIANNLKDSSITLLAEKIETEEEFVRSMHLGYQLFQGYYFEKPVILHRTLPSIAASSYGRILRELHQGEIDFDRCAHIIHSDVVLTYRIMQKIQTLQYYRGNIITAIKLALVMMGTQEFRRWTLLLLARENNVTRFDELVRQSYLRGIFIERLMLESNMAKYSDRGFLLGMFSLLDQILGIEMSELLQEINVPVVISEVLLDKAENEYSRFLDYAMTYEKGDPNAELPDLDLRICPEQVAMLYMECIRETDHIFNELGEVSR